MDSAELKTILAELPQDDKWDLEVAVGRGYSKAGLVRYHLEGLKAHHFGPQGNLPRRNSKTWQITREEGPSGWVWQASFGKGPRPKSRLGAGAWVEDIFWPSIQSQEDKETVSTKLGAAKRLQPNKMIQAEAWYLRQCKELAYSCGYVQKCNSKGHPPPVQLGSDLLGVILLSERRFACCLGTGGLGKGSSRMFLLFLRTVFSWSLLARQLEGV